MWFKSPLCPEVIHPQTLRKYILIETIMSHYQLNRVNLHYDTYLFFVFFFFLKTSSAPNNLNYWWTPLAQRSESFHVTSCHVSYNLGIVPVKSIIKIQYLLKNPSSASGRQTCWGFCRYRSNKISLVKVSCYEKPSSIRGTITNGG